MKNIRIKRALCSISNKANINNITALLHRLGVEIIATSNTAKAIKVKTQKIEDITHFPQILEGRVKTLHPAIFGGLLCRHEKTQHQKDIKKHSITPIDMVIVNLYPFAEAIKKQASEQEIIENIDIGGSSILRAGAKNFEYVTVICDVNDYDQIISELEQTEGSISYQTRRRLASKAFALSSEYESHINKFFQQNHSLPRHISLSAKLRMNMKYGENPQQKAGFYSLNEEQNFSLISGENLSYNNVNDMDCAFRLVTEFKKPCAAIIKHAIPCGISLADSQNKAFETAYQTDKQSAFGGIIAVNQELSADTARQISKIFIEGVIAPEFSPESLKILAKKKKLRLVKANQYSQKWDIKTKFGGLLIQQTDSLSVKEDDLNIVTKRKPTKQEIKDMIFAFTVCKYVKSNAIVCAKNTSVSSLCGGQTSRIQAVEIACRKMKMRPSVLASDAFFPFADNIHKAAQYSVSAIIQTGGSIRDDQVIKAADEYNMAMAFTSIRHFMHG